MRNRRRVVLFHVTAWVGNLALVAIIALAYFVPAIGLSNKGVFLIITLLFVFICGMTASACFGRTRCTACRRLVIHNGHVFAFCPYCGKQISDSGKIQEEKESNGD